MADGTKIEWTDATWNIVNGCSVTSPGCTNCYAMRLAGTRLKHVASREGLTAMSKAGPVWTGETRFNEAVLFDPIRWKRPRRIFVCAHGDLFHESVPDAWIDRVFAVMALAPQHQFQVLTKRAERMRAYLSKENANANIAYEAMDIAPVGRDITAANIAFPPCRLRNWPLPNVWLGVSVEDQKRADERIPHLLATPAAVRWLSCEPLLGPVDLSLIDIPVPGGRTRDENWAVRPLDGRMGIKMLGFGAGDADWLDGNGEPYPRLDWIVVGGESGPGARPMHPDWARSLRDQCAAAGVPFLFKQWGAWAPLLKAWEPDTLYLTTKKAAGRLLDGVQHDGFPA